MELLNENIHPFSKQLNSLLNTKESKVCTKVFKAHGCEKVSTQPSESHPMNRSKNSLEVKILPIRLSGSRCARAHWPVLLDQWLQIQPIWLRSECKLKKVIMGLWWLMWARSIREGVLLGFGMVFLRLVQELLLWMQHSYQHMIILNIHWSTLEFQMGLNSSSVQPWLLAL